MTALVDYFKAVASDIQASLTGRRGQFGFLHEETARIFPNSLPIDVCEAIIRRINEELVDNRSGRVWHDASGSDSRIWQFEREISDLVGYLRLPQLIQATDAYIGRSSRSWLLMANRVTPKEGNLGSGGGLHRDSPFSHQVKCIWYLNDVGVENGAFQYIPGTHRNLIAQRRTSPLGQYRFSSHPGKPTTVTGSAGSLIVCDTRCIHGGRPIVKGVRYAITLYTFRAPDGVERLYKTLGLTTVNDGLATIGSQRS